MLSTVLRFHAATIVIGMMGTTKQEHLNVCIATTHFVARGSGKTRLVVWENTRAVRVYDRSGKERAIDITGNVLGVKGVTGHNGNVVIYRGERQHCAEKKRETQTSHRRTRKDEGTRSVEMYVNDKKIAPHHCASKKWEGNVGRQKRCWDLWQRCEWRAPLFVLYYQNGQKEKAGLCRPSQKGGETSSPPALPLLYYTAKLDGRNQRYGLFVSPSRNSLANAVCNSHFLCAALLPYNDTGVAGLGFLSP